MTNTKTTEPTLRHLSDADLGLDVIHTLRTEAASTGDSEQVAICDRALDGDQDALSECYRVIDAAAAMATYTVQCRHSSGSSCWEPEPECVGLTRAAAERAMAGLEPTDDDGAALEYRIVAD